EEGRDTVATVQGVLDGEVQAFIGLGGNFLRAAPDIDRLAAAWPRLRLAVHVATKLNRSHLVPAANTLLLPCLSRIERDLQGGVEQFVSTEDSTACFHGSHGVQAPASEYLLSEPAIVAGMAEATLEPNPRVPWRAWVADYSRIRDAVEA